MECEKETDVLTWRENTGDGEGLLAIGVTRTGDWCGGEGGEVESMFGIAWTNSSS